MYPARAGCPRVTKDRRPGYAMGEKRCSHGKLKRLCAACNPCPHGKLKRNCTACIGCEHGKLKHRCAACKSARAEQQAAPEIKPEPEIKPDPEIKQEPFTIRGYFGLA